MGAQPHGEQPLHMATTIAEVTRDFFGTETAVSLYHPLLLSSETPSLVAGGVQLAYIPSSLTLRVLLARLLAYATRYGIPLESCLIDLHFKVDSGGVEGGAGSLSSPSPLLSAPASSKSTFLTNTQFAERSVCWAPRLSMRMSVEELCRRHQANNVELASTTEEAQPMRAMGTMMGSLLSYIPSPMPSSPTSSIPQSQVLPHRIFFARPSFSLSHLLRLRRLKSTT